MHNEESKRRLAEQKRAYRKTRKIINLTFRIDEAKRLNAKAKEKHMKIPRYIKSLLQADDNNLGYVVPENQILVQLISEIRKIGTNINQVVHFVNASKNLEYKDITSLNNKLQELEFNITKRLKQPEKIEIILREYLQKYPHHQKQLINCIKSDHQDFRS